MKTFILTVICSFFFLFSISIPAYAEDEIAIFAGGCFWCLEHDLEVLQGVKNVDSGYTGGMMKNPTYRNHKGHQEAVIVEFEPEQISYETILRAYWRNIDPLDGQGQFCDRGDSYRPVIFTGNKLQKDLAETSLVSVLDELNLSSEQIQVEIKSKNKFWLAEDYHQNYAENNTFKYKFYRSSCGRDNRLKDVWGENATSAQPWNSNARE